MAALTTMSLCVAQEFFGQDLNAIQDFAATGLPKANFVSLGPNDYGYGALVTVVQLLTGENWNEVRVTRASLAQKTLEQHRMSSATGCTSSSAHVHSTPSVPISVPWVNGEGRPNDTLSLDRHGRVQPCTP